jgi:hypothetical protein
MPRYVVEREFPEPLTHEQHAEVGKRLDECLPQHGAVWLGSLLSEDGLRMICEFEAPAAENVKDANRSAGAAFKRVWKAEKFTP